MAVEELKKSHADQLKKKLDKIKLTEKANQTALDELKKAKKEELE